MERVPFSHVSDKLFRDEVLESEIWSNKLHMEKHETSPRPAFFFGST
jgi:hypothetical protein